MSRRVTERIKAREAQVLGKATTKEVATETVELPAGSITEEVKAESPVQVKKLRAKKKSAE